MPRHRHPPDAPGEAWTPSQLAFYIGMSVDFVTAEIRAGELPASKFGREWRIYKADVLAYLSAKEFRPRKSIDPSLLKFSNRQSG